MLKLPVLDVDGEKLGVVNDFGIATGEVFPHVTSLAFRGPGKTPFMISWRKWVDRIDETGVHLKTSATEIRFSYLQPTELLLARDVLNKQIVDTQGMKVVRVNDIKFSMSGENQLRLLGAEVGARGLLRAISPALEHIVEGFMKHLGKPLSEDIIAWSYMDLLDRSTKNIQLSVSHKTLGELHPADIADIIEQLDPRLRAQVFAQLDTAQAAEAISEFDDDELMTEMLEGLSDTDASSMLAMMDPDDAADLIDELDYEKAEKLLRLMGVKEEKAIRNLLGYEDNTAGRIMTSEFVSLPATATVGDAIEAIRELDEDFESVYYVYTEDPSGMLTGVLSLRTLIVADRDATLGQLAYRDLVYVSPDEDQEDVTDEMTKYDLVAIPVCDENRHILGIVTFDDAMDVIAEEHQEDLQIAGVGSGDSASDDSTNVLSWFVHRQYWVVVWGIASCIMATVLGTALGPAHLVVFPMCAMPLVLLAASRMVSFVKNYFLEYDGHDDEPKPYLGFFFQSTGMGLILSLVTYCRHDLVRSVLRRCGAAHHVGHWLGGRVQNTKQKSGTKQKLTIAAIFGAMGPGLLAALSGNDAGGIATYSSAGASYGYKMLWMLPVMTVLLIVTQETAARCGCVTGKGLASLIRERFGVRKSVLAMAALLIANTAVTISEFAGIASGLALFGVPASISVPLVALLVWMLTMSGSFQRIEKILLLVSCVFVTYIVAAFMAGPNWGEVAVDLVVPNIQNDPSYVSLVVATIGTTIAPWMIFLAQNNVVDKNAGEDDIVLQRIDTVSGSLAADVIAGFIIITTGTVLFPAGIQISDAADAARALEPIAGQWSTVLFASGLVAASFLAACVLPGVTSSAICEAFGWERGADRSWDEAPVYRGIITAIIGISAVLVLMPGVDLFQIMMTSQVINGVLLPVVLVFQVVIAADRHIMGTNRNGRVWNVLTWATIGVITVLTVVMFVLQAMGYSA